MDQINRKHSTLLQALDTLRIAIDYYKNLANQPNHDEQLALALRDSVIKRFEYCYELFWKFLQVYLEQQERIVLDRHSPKYIFRKSGEVGILLALEVEVALEMCESRNMTSHIYKEEFANFIAQKIPAYYSLMVNKGKSLLASVK